ncbi:hypothetical protein PGT21_007999 [Puccinia graminis f. sp. tritici]|uniref:Uncharacterized protein n=1 Tax=Puccinia graminis f. sp. tritici TaxID=56615 RepID=A0A5B0PX90_PUCGR|nr:hypothetical protein PGTUg99_029644 [Puccinia graminis f. sp. tritici]KAA1105454.1 hypothetical protein PGT21_007999 [Puccinia graminis f. sp. tritici]
MNKEIESASLQSQRKEPNIKLVCQTTPTTPMETPTQRSSRKKMENDHDEDESNDTEEDDSDKEDEEEETPFLTHFLNYSHIIYDVVP